MGADAVIFVGCHRLGIIPGGCLEGGFAGSVVVYFGAWGIFHVLSCIAHSFVVCLTVSSRGFAVTVWLGWVCARGVSWWPGVRFFCGLGVVGSFVTIMWSCYGNGLFSFLSISQGCCIVSAVLIPDCAFVRAFV